jgi:hypothetical protein
MVFYSHRARYDLQRIYDGLLNWQTQNGQIRMDYQAVMKYHDAILDVCDSLDSIVRHINAVYADHRRYGAYVHTYRRNRRTQWYIIYEKKEGNIFIQKIMNNHQTRI